MHSELIQSPEESKIFGVNIARLENLNLDKNEFYSNILKYKSDIIFLNINSKTSDLNIILEDINLPYAIQYISVRCSTELSDEFLKIEQKNIINYEFIEYDSDIHYTTLYQLAKECMEDVKNFSYDHAFFSEYISKDALTEARAVYACTFDNKLNQKKIGFLAKEISTNKIMGFFLLDIISNEFVLAYMGGVQSEYRMSGIGHDGYLKIIQNFLIPRGFKKFAVDMQIQNIGNMKSARIGGKGLQPSDSFLRVNIFPFMNCSRSKIIENNFKGDVFQLINNIKIILNIDNAFNVSNIRKVFFLKNNDDINEFNYELSMPVHSPAKILVVLKIITDKILNTVYYITYS